LRYAALPNVDRYRADIVASIEKSSGMAVKVRSLAGGWGGLRPVVSLEGLEISDRSGRAAFQLQRAEVSLSWWALLAGRLRFQDVDFYRPDLVLRRGADGLIYLADKPLNAAGKSGDGAFTEWLLAQPRLGIHDATLVWRDDFAGAPEVRLTGVEIAVERHLGRHRASLVAVPPKGLASRIDLRADVLLQRQHDQWRARGEAFAEALEADLAGLRAHLPVPETLRSGAGSLRMWLDFNPDGLTEVVADLKARDLRAQLAADVLPLQLSSLDGRAVYRVNADGFTFATQGLNFRTASGMVAQGGNFSLTRRAPQGRVARVEVSADGIDLKIAATLLDYFPVPRDVKGQVLRFAPRGRITQATVSWSDDAAKAYAIKGRFEELAVNAVDAFPGVSGFTGSIEGTEAGGTLQVTGRNATFDLQTVFRAPLAMASFEASARWKQVGRVMHVDLERVAVSNPDAELAFAGTWHSLPEAKEKSPGHIELKGRITRAVAARVANYLPNRNTVTRDWLERSILGGEVTRGNFELRGDLYEFPFGGESKGLFLVELDARNAQLRYHPNWPSVDAIDGTIRFHNRRMEILASRATIFGSRVRAASAVIEDLSQKPPVLTIDGDIDTTGSDTVRFLRESPLVNGPGAFTRAVAIEGPARFKLRLVYPLFGTERMRITGDYLFAGATASVGRTLALRDIKGRLTFTERGVQAPELTGTMFGKPATVAMSNDPDGRVVTAIEGSIDVPVLGAYVPEPISARLTGAAAWKARVLSGKEGTEVTITSDLKGLGSTLPEPATKDAASARPLTIRIERIGTEGEVAAAALDGGLYWRSNRTGPNFDRWQVALKMGAPVGTEPVRDGLWLYGAAAFLDVDAWTGVFAQPRREEVATAPEERAGGFGLRGVDLRMDRVRYFAREFMQVGARLERSDLQWNGTIESPLVAGAVNWSPEGKARVVARLERLSIPEARPQGVAAPPSEADLPALDVQAERFEFRGRHLGRLDLKAQHVGDEWRIDRLNITSDNAKFTSTGGWRRTGPGSITTLNISLDADNLSGLLGQFGYGDYVKRGSAHLNGTLAWQGFPGEFNTSILSGSFRADARRGQFAKIEPGAGKLLGLMSLQSLPRRAMFDYSDVFSEGFAFETINGNVKLARGILITDNFEISGPSAFVSLAGEVSLPLETQSLTLRVVPEVGESMALAATLLGTPVIGLSTLLVSKLLRNPMGKVVAYEYQVTGSWDNPQVTRLSAPPVPAAAPAPVPVPAPVPAPAKPATTAEASK
jgi:uncharacterized protein (TIGR02099 family)